MFICDRLVTVAEHAESRIYVCKCVYVCSVVSCDKRNRLAHRPTFQEEILQGFGGLAQDRPKFGFHKGTTANFQSLGKAHLDVDSRHDATTETIEYDPYKRCF